MFGGIGSTSIRRPACSGFITAGRPYRRIARSRKARRGFTKVPNRRPTRGRARNARRSIAGDLDGKPGRSRKTISRATGQWSSPTGSSPQLHSRPPHAGCTDGDATGPVAKPVSASPAATTSAPVMIDAPSAGRRSKPRPPRSRDFTSRLSPPHNGCVLDSSRTEPCTTRLKALTPVEVVFAAWNVAYLGTSADSATSAIDTFKGRTKGTFTFIA